MEDVELMHVVAKHVALLCVVLTGVEGMFVVVIFAP